MSVAENDTERLWVVEFYAHVCPHCQHFAPVWKGVADELNKGGMVTDLFGSPLSHINDKTYDYGNLWGVVVSAPGMKSLPFLVIGLTVPFLVKKVIKLGTRL